MFKNLVSFKTVLWTTSVILAVCSAAFSVFGLSKLFAGAALSVIIMASTLEFAKLITVTFIHNYYAEIKRGMRYYLLSASLVLMIITSLGVYGFLTNAYQLALKNYAENNINSEFIQKNKELLNKELQYIEKEQQDLNQRLQSYDKIRLTQESSLLNNNTKTGIQKNIKSTTKLTDDISKKLDILSDKKNKLLDSLMTLEKQVLNIDIENNQTELGPLIYISKITGYEMDYVVNIFVIIITLVFDPLAIALLLAANFLTKLQQPPSNAADKNTEIDEENPEEINLQNTEKNDILQKTDYIKKEYDNIVMESEIKNDTLDTNTNQDNSGMDTQVNFYGETEALHKHPWKVGI